MYSQIIFDDMIPIGVVQQAEEFQIVIGNRAVCQRTCGVAELMCCEQVASEFLAELNIYFRTGAGIFDEIPEMVVASFPQAAVVFAYNLMKVLQEIPVTPCGIEKSVLFVNDGWQAFGSDQLGFAEHFGIMRLFLLGTRSGIDIDAQCFGTSLLHRIGDSDRRVIVKV